MSTPAGTGIERAEVDRLKASVSLAAVIAETMPLQRAGRLLTACCPFHADKTPSFTVYPDQHYHCFGCGARGDVLTWLMRTRRVSFAEALAHLGSPDDRSRTQAATPTAGLRAARADDADAERNRELARRIWIKSTDPHGTPVETYLQHRRVRLPNAPAIRWHPNCPRGDDALPAMVALMTDPVTGEPSGIHRTFLLPDGTGKAPVDPQKMMLGTAGVIRLADDRDIGVGLGLAEGIETALAVTQRLKWGPCWASGSAGAIRAFPVLPATTLNIFADADGTGLISARECAARWTAAGHEVLIHIPPSGEDWRDAVGRLAV